MQKNAHDFYHAHLQKLLKETGGTLYAITPEEFERLIGEPSIQTSLCSWFGVSVVTTEGDTTFTLPSGEVVDISTLYIETQSQPEMSYKLYQKAMTIWR